MLSLLAFEVLLMSDRVSRELRLRGQRFIRSPIHSSLSGCRRKL